jgi:hypothetical protein
LVHTSHPGNWTQYHLLLLALPALVLLLLLLLSPLL